MANTIEGLLRTESWDNLPETMIKLYPHLADIQINRMTRDPAEWAGAYDKIIGN